MPTERARKRAMKDRREGKAPTTQAGEFIREEIHHIREGKHGARSTKQAIAIGLSKARKAGVDLPPPGEGKTSEKTRRSAELAYETGQGRRRARRPSSRRKAAISGVMKREPRSAASYKAMSKQAKSAASRRSAGERSAAARKAARTRAGNK